MSKITKEDVWGKFDEQYNLVDRGMIVAQGFSESADMNELMKKLQTTNICPVWKDKLPYKSVTVICDESQASEVSYWLSYVHGGDCISKEKKLPDGKFAFRSNYMCW